MTFGSNTLTKQPDPRVSTAILRLGVMAFGALMLMVFVIIVWALLRNCKSVRKGLRLEIQPD